MAKTSTSWVKGQSGNPGGKPKKEREETAALVRTGRATIEIDGVRVSRRKLLVEQFWSAMLTGEIEFPVSGKKVQLRAHHWSDLLKWYFSHVDGPPRVAAAGTADDPVHQVGWSSDEWKALEEERMTEAEATLAAWDDNATDDDAGAVPGPDAGPGDSDGG